MSTPKPLPTKNPGNRRRGRARGYRGQPGGSRNLSWREDIVCRERVILVRRLMAEGLPVSEMLPTVNAFMRARGQPEITANTVYDDRKRAFELLNEDEAESHQMRRQAIDSLQLVKQEAWKAFRAASRSSLNRGSYLNTVKTTEVEIAKLNGVYAQQSLAPIPEGLTFGPSISELLKDGKITQAEFEIHMKLVAKRAGTSVPGEPTPPPALPPFGDGPIYDQEPEPDPIPDLGISDDLPARDYAGD